MCGIVAYLGTQQAAPLLLEGLTRLEHRGYDSAGLALVASGQTEVRTVKQAGRVRDLAPLIPKRLSSHVGIGHTRWATHGPANDANAHPHVSHDNKVAVVHNGIIDNSAQLRAELTAAGIELASDTDTEVLAHLIGGSNEPTLVGRVSAALARVDGTFGIAVLHADFPDEVVVARNGSPLIIGVGDKEIFVASDLGALVRHTTTLAYLEDGEIARLTATGFTTFTLGRLDAGREGRAELLDLDPTAYDAGDHESFMRKEMSEQPEATERTLRGRLDERFGGAHLGGLNMDARDLRAVRRVKVLGCGSAYYVGQMGASMIEELARVPADAEAASEFRYRNPVIEPDTLYVAVSQSGETLDTLLAVQEIRRKGGRVVGLVNVVGSAIARECDGGIYLHAGPEVAVASTKALTCMYIGFSLLALQLGRVRDLSVAQGGRLVRGLARLPKQIQQVLDNEDQLVAVAKRLAEADSLFFVGRVRGYPVAREGAQKFKEITYRHAEAYQTSELKHGPLALISADVPTVAIVPQDELAERNVGALHEITARGGPLLVISHEEVDLGDLDGLPTVERINVPKNEIELDPLLLVLPLQLLAYHAARSLELDVDKPRNLAKSVTVE